MDFKKPENIEEGPVWKGESAENETEQPDESNGETPDNGGSDVETVEFGKTPDSEGMEMTVPEGVELAGEMLARPEAYDLARLGHLQELEEENEELRETVEQQSKAISDLAEAVESLTETQAELAGADIPATVQLDSAAFGDIYSPESYDIDS